MMKRLQTGSVVLTLVLFSIPSFGDEHTTSTSAPNTSQQSTQTRPAADTQLPDKEADLISTLFEIPKTEVVKRWSTSLPQAIEKARPVSAGGQGDETDLSKIMATLIGTRTNQQMDNTVMPKVAEEIAKQPKDGADKNRYLDFLNRIVWAGKVVNGTDSPKPEAQAFNTAFKKDLKSNQDELKTVAAKVKDALNGNTTAKQFLRDNVNRASIMSFIDSKRKAGDLQTASDYASALSWNVDGKKVLYVKNPAGEIKTWPLGNSPTEINTSLKMFSDTNHGFGGFALSLYPPPTPPVVAQQQQAQPTQNRGTNSQQTPPASGGITADSVKGAVASKCQGCHQGTTASGDSLKNLTLTVKGHSHSLGDALAALDPANGPMKDIPDDLKASIRAWAAAAN